MNSQNKITSNRNLKQTWRNRLHQDENPTVVTSFSVDSYRRELTKKTIRFPQRFNVNWH